MKFGPPTRNHAPFGWKWAFRYWLGLAVILFFVLTTPVAIESQAPAAAPQQEKKTTIAKGLEYVHLTRTTPQGEPWSIHVLEMSRKEKSLALRTVRARNEYGEMVREKLTEMAKREIARGADVLAVVNGDYDIAAPYLGVSDGLSISSGVVSTTGKSTWPVFALHKNGEPLIGVPQVQIEASAGNSKWTWIDALNKPPDSVHTTQPRQGFLRMLTADFRPKMERAVPFCAVKLTDVKPTLPVRINRAVKARVSSVESATTSVTIGPQEIVLVKAGPRELPQDFSFCNQLRVGQRVTIRVSVRVAGKSDVRDAIGGFPILVQGGRRTIVGEPGPNLKLRHPRTAVCYNKEKIIFVVVDGRQPKLSVGMTLEELGDLMVELGCETAMNTDGGGSSVMAITGDSLRIVNSPSDGLERGRGNAFLIVRKK